MLSLLIELYGDTKAFSVHTRLKSHIEKYQLLIQECRDQTQKGWELDQRDSILITYADQVQDSHTLPLVSLVDFCLRFLPDVVSGIHILPFFPYSSDDGFSVIDYREVDPNLGSWDEISHLSKHFRLMFDLVINHVSAKSKWFLSFLQEDPEYKDFFIVIDKHLNLSKVVRPRTSPLAHDFESTYGKKSVWTTFSTDQIDLNYQNPDVLLEMIEIMLFYVYRGAEFIRLDAIAYLWKEIGTPCIHHPHTHHVVQLLRAVLDAVAPWVKLVTETNVPHIENISYFGDGVNEAQMVYNFALPPLILYTIQTGNCTKLTQWAESLTLPSNRTTFFNFLASHDGIGLNPVRGILSEEEIQALVERTINHGGLISSKSNPDGTIIPYELNINYFDVLSDPFGNEPEEVQIDRFLCAQAIQLAIIGVPGIYFHSLFGSRGWLEGAEIIGHNRAINRQKLSKSALEAELTNPEARRYKVFQQYSRLLKARSSSPAFDPYGSQYLIDCGKSVFALIRKARTGSAISQSVLCIHNITDKNQVIGIDSVKTHRRLNSYTEYIDLVSKQVYKPAEPNKINLLPYQVLWLCIN